MVRNDDNRGGMGVLGLRSAVGVELVAMAIASGLGTHGAYHKLDIDCLTC
jgi:hypothetical protein